MLLDCHGTAITKIDKKHKLLVTCKKIKYFIIGLSTNKKLFQMLKSKKFNDPIVLTFLECSCCIQNLVIRHKETISQICVVPFSNLGN